MYGKRFIQNDQQKSGLNLNEHGLLEAAKNLSKCIYRFCLFYFLWEWKKHGIQLVQLNHELYDKKGDGPENQHKICPSFFTKCFVIMSKFWTNRDRPCIISPVDYLICRILNCIAHRGLSRRRSRVRRTEREWAVKGEWLTKFCWFYKKGTDLTQFQQGLSLIKKLNNKEFKQGQTSNKTHIKWIANFYCWFNERIEPLNLFYIVFKNSPQM